MKLELPTDWYTAVDPVERAKEGLVDNCLGEDGTSFSESLLLLIDVLDELFLLNLGGTVEDLIVTTLS
jgi:hypothetical protein